jgi:hypothetical protein
MEPMTTTTVARSRRVLLLGILAFLAGLAAIIGVIVTGNRYLDQLHTACNYPRPRPLPAWAGTPCRSAWQARH